MWRFHHLSYFWHMWFSQEEIASMETSVVLLVGLTMIAMGAAKVKTQSTS